jgi:hypothetical protein
MKEILKKLNACNSAMDWANGKTWEEVYNTCHRGDWLLWLFKKTNPDDLRRITLAKGHCAATVIHLMKSDRSINAIKVAIAYGEGNASKQDLNLAAGYAGAAYAGAAYAAAYAGAAYAADAAAAAAAAAGYAGAAGYAAAKLQNQKETADICRKYLPINIWNIN